MGAYRLVGHLLVCLVTNGLMNFDPKADGIEDFVLENYDDWQVLRVGICAEVVRPGGGNPVT